MKIVCSISSHVFSSMFSILQPPDAGASSLGAGGALIARLAGLYVSFNVLLYGGIYTVNALVALEEDKGIVQRFDQRMRELSFDCFGDGVHRTEERTAWTAFLLDHALCRGVVAVVQVVLLGLPATISLAVTLEEGSTANIKCRR